MVMPKEVMKNRSMPQMEKRKLMKGIKKRNAIKISKFKDSRDKRAL